jgi:hypothetical protein
MYGGREGAETKLNKAALLKLMKVFGRIIKSVHMVNPQTSHLSFSDELKNQLMDLFENVKYLRSYGSQFIDIEKTPVVDLLCGHPPVREAIRLSL